jgi:hypothetical protein
MKGRLLILLLLLTSFSCAYNDFGICGDADLQWLEDQKAELQNSETSRKYFYIEMAYYEGQPVFYVNSCCPLCLTVITYRDCSGNEIAGVDPSKLKDRRRIWLPEENECYFTF